MGSIQAWREWVTLAEDPIPFGFLCIATEPPYRVLAANKRARQLLGLSSEWVEEVPLNQVIRFDHLAWTLDEIVLKILDTGQLTLTKQRENPSGEQILLELIFSRHDTDSAPVILLILRDNTMQLEIEQALMSSNLQMAEAMDQRALELEAANEKLTRYVEMLQVANARVNESMRVKDAFLANLSHELRHPLNAILGYGQLLQTGKFESEKQEHRVNQMLISARRLLELIDNLLQLSEMRQNATRLAKDRVNLAALIHDTFRMLHLTFPEHDYDHRVVVDDAMPMMQSDRLKLQQIIYNLVSNSIKYSSGKAEIVVKAEREEDDILLSVEDKGVGIPQEKLTSIFEQFTQADDSYTREHGGLGIGLALTKSYVDILGGQIQVDSEVNQGTTFSIRLPFTEARHDESYTSQDLAFVADIPRSTVLVVDDQESNLTMMREVLELIGSFEVIPAHSSTEALEKCANHAVDLAIVDIRLHGEDGLSFVKLMRSMDRFKTTPIIAMSAYVMQDTRQRAEEAGCDWFFSKPIRNLSSFAIKLSQLLSGTDQAQLETESPTNGSADAGTLN